MLKYLSEIESGRTAKLFSVDSGLKLEKRLGDMGFLPGGIYRVIKNDRHGPVILDIKGSRIMLGRSISTKVKMEETND